MWTKVIETRHWLLGWRLLSEVVGIRRFLGFSTKGFGHQEAPYVKRRMCIWFLPTVVEDYHCPKGLWVIRVFDGQVLVLDSYKGMGKR